MINRMRPVITRTVKYLTSTYAREFFKKTCHITRTEASQKERGSGDENVTALINNL